MQVFSENIFQQQTATHDTRTDDEKNENWSAYYLAVYGEVSGNVKTTNLRMFYIVWLK